MGKAWLLLAGALVALCSACGAADRELDLDALEARDLLGLAPEIGLAWSAGDREEVRAALTRAGDADARESAPLGLSDDPSLALLASISDIDHRRALRGDDALAFGRLERRGDTVLVASLAAAAFADTPDGAAIVAVGWERGEDAGWDQLAGRAPAALAAVARAAGYRAGDGPLYVSPAPREPFAALYLPDRRQLWVNPIFVAALEPEGDAAEAVTVERRAGDAPATTAGADAYEVDDGNPYSFYGSLAECAAGQRLRCDRCFAEGGCDARTRDTESGLTECQSLAAENGRGYFLLCANLAAAIETVADCVEDRGPSCPLNREAGNLLSALDANAALLDDAACLDAVDGCLADIYGEPEEDYPDLPDPGGEEPPDPPEPRDTEVSCTSDSNVNCDFDPDFSCSVESCSASPSCGTCDSGCDEGSCDPSCEGGGCDGAGCSGDGCDSGCDSGGCDSGGCDSGCDSGGCDNSCSGSSSSTCSVARSPRLSPWLYAGMWIFLPLPVLERLRRREARRRSAAKEDER